MPQQESEASADGRPSSHRTVVVAGAANLAIALAKTVAAALTGSAGLWAEAAHSFADTGNQALLFVGLRKSRGGADERHPFGYGQERYFWSFLAAIGIFVIGGLLSIGEGIRSLLNPEPVRSAWVGIAVLVVAAAFEGYSWYTARRQLRTEARARRRSVIEHVSTASDPSPTAVYLEDSAALIGIALALTALILDLLTGRSVWDGIAGVAIGVLLIVVAVLLARRTKSLLLDESVPADVMDDLRHHLRMDGATTQRLVAVYVGPSQILVCADLRPEDGLLTGPADELVNAVAALREHMLKLPHVVAAEINLVPTA
jgi:cation diffusion facilitator family transporter